IASLEKGRASVVYKVTQVLQFNREVHAIDHDLFRHMQYNRCEIQQASDPETNELVGDFLRCRRRYGQNSHLDLMLTKEPRQSLHLQDWLTDLRFPPPMRLDIEGGHNLKALLFEPTIGQQSQTEIPHAHKDDRLQTSRA